MNNKIYNKLLYSINKEIKNVIHEQFNIGKMNLNGNNNKAHKNIFNKEQFNPADIYDKILNDIKLEEYEILYLNNNISIITPKNIDELYNVIIYYS